MWDRTWLGLGAAVVLPVIGTVLRLTLFGYAEGSVHFVTYYPMVILAALLGGLAAGLLATGLSVALTYFWVQAGAISSSEWRSVIVFVVSCSAISLIVEYMHRTRMRAQRAEADVRLLNAELEMRVVQRTEQLEEALHELESFAYSVSHDLRGPLRSIDGFSAMVIEDVGDRLGDDAIEHLERVRAASQRMGSLIDSLLALARTSRRELVRTEVDLSLMSEEVIQALQEADPERIVDVTIARDMQANADETLAEVVLSNLLGNAWKFTKTSPEAHIECGVLSDGGERVFFVKDDGVGFDPRYVKNLFGVFQRLHTGDQFEGEGIGLATVDRIVRHHGGRVWAESELEKGATFYFTLAAPAP